MPKFEKNLQKIRILLICVATVAVLVFMVSRNVYISAAATIIVLITGITTTNDKYQRGLDVDDKSVRVANFHTNTIDAIKELVGAMGLHDISELKREHVYRRVAINKIDTYADLFPQPEEKLNVILNNN